MPLHKGFLIVLRRRATTSENRPRIERIPQAVADEIHAEDEQRNQDARRQPEPRRPSGRPGPWASMIMLPRLGSGAWTPSPRNDSDASSRIALAMPKVATTVSGPTRFGSMWRVMIGAVLDAQDAHRGNELGVPQRQQLAAHDPRHDRPAEEADHRDHGEQARPHDRHEDDHQQQRRDVRTVSVARISTWSTPPPRKPANRPIAVPIAM